MSRRPRADRMLRRPMTVADVVCIIPAEHPLVRLGIGLADVIDLVKARELFHVMRARAIARTVENGDSYRARPRRAGSPRTCPRGCRTDATGDMARTDATKHTGRGYCPVAEVENTSGLIHAFTRAVDRGQERQRARDEDARRHGEVSPAKRYTGRQLLEQGHGPTPIRRDKLQRAPGQFGRMFEFASVIHKPMDCPPKMIQAERLARDPGEELACRLVLGWRPLPQSTISIIFSAFMASLISVTFTCPRHLL